MPAPDPNTSDDVSSPLSGYVPAAAPGHTPPADGPPGERHPVQRPSTERQAAVTRADWLAISDPVLCYGTPGEVPAPPEPTRPTGVPLFGTGPTGAVPGGPVAGGTSAGADESQPFEHFRLVRRLGEGGMGIVYQAEDLQLRRAVALKIMKTGSTIDRARFLREARAMAALKSDHVVTIYEVGAEEAVPYFAMELLQGMPLDQRLRTGPPFSLAELFRVGREVALGLAAAHAQGVVHRDIKPANVWLESPSGRAKILDFGLVRNEHGDARLTGMGMAVGTPGYAAPEQACGKQVDARADLYSFGCVLYEMATGRLPLVSNTPMGMLVALASEIPAPIVEANPDVPAGLSGLVDQLLAKNPADRPASAQEVADRLSDLERRGDLSGRPAGRGDEPVSAATAAEYTRLLVELTAQTDDVRRRSVARGAALALTFCLTVGLLLNSLRGRDSGSRPQADPPRPTAQGAPEPPSPGPK